MILVSKQMLLQQASRGLNPQLKQLDQLLDQGNRYRKGMLESKPRQLHKLRLLSLSPLVNHSHNHSQELLNKLIMLKPHLNQESKGLDKVSKSKLEQLKTKILSLNHK